MSICIHEIQTVHLWLWYVYCVGANFHEFSAYTVCSVHTWMHRYVYSCLHVIFTDKFSSSEKEDTDSAKQDSKDVSQNSQTQDSEKVDAGSKSASENQQKTEKMEKTDAKDVSSSSHSEKSEKAHTVSETDAVDKNAEKQDSKDKVADKEKAPTRTQKTPWFRMHWTILKKSSRKWGQTKTER